MNWTLFAPEIFTLVMAMIFLGLSLASPNARRSYVIALLLAAVGAVIGLLCIHGKGDLFYDTYRIDFFSQAFKVLVQIGLLLAVGICFGLGDIDERHHAEFYLLLSVCSLAMMMLISSVHMVTLYVSLELSSYSLYILVFLRKDGEWGLKAGLKYFLIGASASALMLFGMAVLYGTAKVAYLADLIQIGQTAAQQPLVMTAMAFLLCGFFFKLAVFPLHFWAPDVYEGATNELAAFIATASKVAAIAVLIRILALFGQSGTVLADYLAVLSIVSMTVGNLSAIIQNDLKRLLAYSSIAHGGYVLIGILSMNATGYGGAAFYAAALVCLKFTCFLVVVVVAGGGGNLEVKDLAGLHRRSPLLALALMMALFGLAGIPPTIGFTGKLLLFTAALENGYLSLVLIAMGNVVISLYYYLLVLKAAYLMEPDQELPVLQVPVPLKILTVILIAVIVVMGFFPTPLIDLAQEAARSLM